MMIIMTINPLESLNPSLLSLMTDLKRSRGKDTRSLGICSNLYSKYRFQPIHQFLNCFDRQSKIGPMINNHHF